MPGEFTNPAYINPGAESNVAMFLGMAAEGATAKVAAEADVRAAAISAALASEASARSAAIASEVATRAAADTTAATALANEATTRAAADAAMNTALASEVATRATADTTATTALANEAAVRASADNALTTKIDGDITTEANTRATADTALASKINADVLAEANARTAADAALSDSIAALSQAGESMTIGNTAPVNSGPTSNMIVSGITSHPASSGVYQPSGTGYGGYPTYVFGAYGIVSMLYGESPQYPAWIIVKAAVGVSPGATLYRSSSNTAFPTPDLVPSWTAITGAGAPSVTAEIAVVTESPPYLRVAGGFLYVREAGVWKKAALSAL